MRTFLVRDAEGVWATLGDAVAGTDCSGEIEGEADCSVAAEGDGVVGSCAAAKEKKVADSNAKMSLLVMSSGAGEVFSLSLRSQEIPPAKAGKLFLRLE